MSFDKAESQKSTKILLSLGIVALALIALLIFIIPDVTNTLSEFQNGVGFKDAAIYSFFTTIILLVILTIAAGDGLIGELQFLLIGFLVFFIIIWLFIAWIF